MTQPTVIIYDRLSRLFADERPDHRIKQCREYAERRGWHVLHVAIDTDVSGATALEDREGMREVLARLPHADYVIASKLDRFARSVLEFERLTQAARAANATVVTADGAVSPETATLFVQMLAAFAQWERETIQTRIRDSKEYFRARGNHLGGLAPYGYRVVGPVNAKRWEIDPVSAEVIRGCADQLINRGTSLTALTHALNDQGTLSPADHARERDGRETRGTKWSTSTLRDVLYTPAVRGWMVQAVPGTRRSAQTNQPVLDGSGEPISVGPEILDAETWSAVRAILDGKSVGKGVERNGKSLLLHVARCSECDGPMYRQARTVKGRDYSTYVCPRGVGQRGEHAPNVIIAAQLEQFVTDDYLRRWGRFRLMTWREPDGAALLQLSEVTGQIERLAGNLANLDPNGRAASVVIGQIGALERRQTELSMEAAQSVGRWEATGRTVADEWAARGADGRRQLLGDLGAVVTVSPMRPGAPRRFDSSRADLAYSGPAWARELEPHEDILKDIAEHER
jgi:DNA invertase Pin-like site-specific DNA recombinase